MTLRFFNLWERLRSSYWFVPGLMAILATALSFGMAEVDEAYGSKFVQELGWIYTGGPDGARGVLSAIGSSVMGVAGTTFSITIAVLSLTSGQYGPRLLRGFMRDLGNQIVLGTFTSTFLYCILVLRTIRGTEQTTYVPHFSVTVGVVLAILCVAVLIYFVHHVAESIQVSHIISSVGQDTDDAVRRLFSKDVGSGAATPRPPTIVAGTLVARSIGYVESIDGDALLKIATKHALVLRVEFRPGEYVMPEETLVSVWPALPKDHDALHDAFSFGRRRTSSQDAEFAFLQLAEIAVRALSPGINDPFTAVQCLDRITASMCLLSRRPWPSSHRYDDSGDLRLVLKPVSPDEMVRAAYGHIRHAAKDTPFVLEKLRSCLDTLIALAEEPSLTAALVAEKMRAGLLGPPPPQPGNS